MAKNCLRWNELFVSLALMRLRTLYQQISEACGPDRDLAGFDCDFLFLDFLETIGFQDLDVIRQVMGPGVNRVFDLSGDLSDLEEDLETEGDNLNE